jgi:hypothetical protein
MNLCPGCGRPQCPCTPANVRHQLEQDRAELSQRASEWAPRTNEAVRLLREARGYGYASLDREIDAWLAAVEDR